MKYYGPTKFNYYDNSHLCGNCNGNGCKQCIGSYGNPLGLQAWGCERFPLHHSVSGAKPPAIVNYYAEKFNRFRK